jgi:hypothetical protein
MRKLKLSELIMVMEVLGILSGILSRGSQRQFAPSVGSSFRQGRECEIMHS